MENNWIPLTEIVKVMLSVKNNKWSWAFNPRCKYINVRIDMRDGRCVISDRVGNKITLEELQYQNTPDYLKGD